MESPFSSNFFLYANGLRVQHTVRTAESIEDHVSVLGQFMAALAAAGHTPTEAGLEEGQERHNICGYVVSVSSRNDKVLHCYTDYWDQAARGGSIYEDHWDELPFVPNVSKIYDGVGKLPKDLAKSKGYFIPQAFEIVITKTGKLTESGKEQWRFVSANLPSAKTAAPTPAAANTVATVPAEGKTTTVPADLCDTICTFIATKVQQPQDLVNASLEAFARKRDLEGCWDRVQAAIRTKLVALFNEALAIEGDKDGRLTELASSVRAITKVLPDGYADQLCQEIDASKSGGTAF